MEFVGLRMALCVEELLQMFVLKNVGIEELSIMISVMMEILMQEMDADLIV